MLSEQEKGRIRRSLACDAPIVLFAAIGVWRHYARDGWAMFQYYTLCSNLFLMLACALRAWYGGTILAGGRYHVPSWAKVLKYLAVCMTSVTFCVVLLILVPMAGGVRAIPYYFFSGAMICHHLLCPALGFVSFVFFDGDGLSDPRLTLWALVPTLVYAAVTTALNVLGALYGPYPFLRVREQSIYISAVWYAAICAMAWVLAYLVWKLALNRGTPRELPAHGGRSDGSPARLPEADAWTVDGYLKDQDCLSGYTYRTIPASVNGCGPVAAYDLRRFAGQDAAFTDVLAEMDGLHLLRVPGPTRMRVMRKYFAKYLPGWREARGRDACLASAAGSRMGVFRYHEQKVPHFVAYIRADGGAYRFFNVCDGAEDKVFSMSAFGREHLLGGSVRLISWD